MFWYSHLFQNIPQFIVIHTVKGFGIVNKAEINVFLITNLEPDILECEVKWALESITTNKASGGDGIPVELFQILKDFDAVKVLHSICQQIWKTSSDLRTGKGQVSLQSLREAMPKNAQTTAQLHSSHTKLDSTLKSRDITFANKGPSSQGYGFSSGHVWMCELDNKES